MENNWSEKTNVFNDLEKNIEKQMKNKGYKISKFQEMLNDEIIKIRKEQYKK